MHTVFSEKHADYTGVKDEGPLKSGHYRYFSRPRAGAALSVEVWKVSTANKNDVYL